MLGGRIYLYNSNDDDNPLADGYQMKSIVCVSSADLKNWTDHGVVFSVPADAWGHYRGSAPSTRWYDLPYFGATRRAVGVA